MSEDLQCTVDALSVSQQILAEGRDRGFSVDAKMRCLKKLNRVTNPNDTAAKRPCKSTSAPSKLGLEACSNLIHSATRSTGLRDFKDSFITNLHPLTLHAVYESDSSSRDILLHLPGAELEISQSLVFDEKNLTSALCNCVSIAMESQPFNNFRAFNKHHRFAMSNAELKRDDGAVLTLHPTTEGILDD